MTSASAIPGYDSRDVVRLAPEPAKPSARTPFERDRARVVHSASFRRLSAKTQVVGPGTDDFVRNRLTHSLEVAQVARELGKALGCDADVVEAAALAHDLGHPPFGHNGERALHEAAADIGGFEGNAQTLRILTRLEAKTFAAHGSGQPESVGLNLTRAVLDACIKYPWPLDDRSATEAPKFGVYSDDAAVFAWIRDGAPSTQRCMEAQVMDLADDVAYSVHDVEDAVVAGQLDLPGLLAGADLDGVWAAVHDWYLPQADDARLMAALRRLVSLPEWPQRPYDGTRAGQAQLKGLTSALIGRFCNTVDDATRLQYGGGQLTRYAAHLALPDDVLTEIAVLKGIAAHFVMRIEERMLLLDDQRDLLAELVAALASKAPQELETVFQEDYAAASDDAARLRVVIDQVASLTDASALTWHSRLCSD